MSKVGRTYALGISGFPRAVDFKTATFPGLDPRCYRMVQGLDAAAAMVSNGAVIAAVAEERLCRAKGTNRFPKQAIDYCCRAANVTLADVDFVAHAFDHDAFEAYFLDDAHRKALYLEVLTSRQISAELERAYPGEFDPSKFVAVPHHTAHAASAFYESGFAESLVVVMDGMGESESLSVFVGSRAGLQLLERIPARSSLGILYGVVTHYLGFQMNQDEYKVMGLAPFGEPGRYEAQFRDLVQFHREGAFTIPALTFDRTPEERESHEGAVRFLEMLFGPRRSPRDELTQRHRDVAAAMQALLERTVLSVLAHFRTETGLARLCMAGGVALNCVVNGAILRSGLFEKVHVHAAAGDDGSALGAARYVDALHGTGSPGEPAPLPFWGPGFGEVEIGRALAGLGDGVSVTTVRDHAELVGRVSGELAEGKTVGWFQGRSEFGPRALGNRSILADPRSPLMRERINRVIKQREIFRPFAPAVLEEHAARIFDLDSLAETSLETMLFTVPVRPEYRDRLGAVSHVDGSARIQTVSRTRHPLFWSLLSAFGERTGVPVLLNTSFNVDEPIVNTPEEACATFAGSSLDLLVLGRNVVHKA